MAAALVCAATQRVDVGIVVCKYDISPYQCIVSGDSLQQLTSWPREINMCRCKTEDASADLLLSAITCLRHSLSTLRVQLNPQAKHHTPTLQTGIQPHNPGSH